MRRTLVLLTAGAALGAGVVAAGVPGSAGARPATKSTVRTLAPGVVLKRIVIAGPTRVFVLQLTPATGLSLRTVLAGPMGDFHPTSQIAKGRGAFAAINGEFSVTPGRPMHSFVAGGDLALLGRAGAAFGFSSDLRHKTVLQARPVVSVLNVATKTSFTISDFNSGDPTGHDVVAYTTYGTSGGYRPPSDACSARLGAPSKLHWGSTSQVGVYRTWVVQTVACQHDPIGVQPGTMVLSAGLNGAGAYSIQQLAKDTKVRVSWSLGRKGLDQTIAGMPQIVTNGVDTAPPQSCGTYFCSANARTAVGVTAKGAILLVVVDGHQSSWSQGLTLWQLGHEMIALGARNAVNLDGSGAATMWIKGLGVINRPEDRCQFQPYPACLAGQRPVSNALLVMRGPTHELTPLPYAVP